MVELSTSAMQPAAPPPDCSKPLKSIQKMAQPLPTHEKRMKSIAVGMANDARALGQLQQEGAVTMAAADSTWTTHMQATDETLQNDFMSDHGDDDFDEPPSAKAVSGLQAFLHEDDDDDDAPAITSETRISKINKTKSRKEKPSSSRRGPAVQLADTKRKAPPAATTKRGKLDDKTLAERASIREENRMAAERAEAKEAEIMRGGAYFKIRDEQRQRANDERTARRNRMETRAVIDKTVKQAGVQAMEKRQNLISVAARDFYNSPLATEDRVLGEVVKLVPQHSLGWIVVLGDEALLPKRLREDAQFLTGSGGDAAKKMQLSGINILHQPLVPGDLVVVQFERGFIGTDVQRDDRPWLRATPTKYVATSVEIYKSNLEIPFKQELLVNEVRTYMLGLLTLMEAGADLALYTKLVQEIEIWKRILGEPFTNKSSGGLMDWHVLLMINISCRAWLDSSEMKILLWSFFNSYRDSKFLTTVLPYLLGKKNGLPDHAIFQVAQVVYLYKKHTGADVMVLYRLLRKREPIMGKDFKKVLDKIHGILDEDKSFVALLHEATYAGYNALTIVDKNQLKNVQHAIEQDKLGLDVEMDDFDCLPKLSEFEDEDYMTPDRLPKNQISGPWESPAMYTRSAFQLLRADLYKEFQFAMHHKVHKQSELENCTDQSVLREINLPATWFHLTDILGVNYTTKEVAGRLCYSVRFRIGQEMQEAWKIRMLQVGNLIGLTTDRFDQQVWWAVVSHRDQTLLTQGIVGLEFIRGNPRVLQERLEISQRKGLEKKMCWMVEARTVFFAGARPVLEALQQFGRNAIKNKHCPFEDYMVYGRNVKSTPPWVLNNKAIFLEQLKTCIEENTFDPSQERAIRGLENNFLLVQGPPGTGKSYTGVKMVDVILRTRFAALERMEKDQQGKVIEACMGRARNGVIQYQELHEKLQKNISEVMKMKSIWDKKKKESDKKTIRLHVKELLAAKSKIEREMTSIDGTLGKLFARIMALEQKKEQAMLEYEKDTGPIQIITYKNHSLDEFLMDVMPSLKVAKEDSNRREGIVRFGSRSQCDELLQYNVNEHTRRFETDPNMDKYGKLILSSLRSTVTQLQNLGAEIVHLNAENLTVECLKCSLTPIQEKNFGEITDQKIEAWRREKHQEVLVSLEDSAKNAAQEELERKAGQSEESEDFGEDEGMPNTLQAQRDLMQSREDQEKEEKAKERFMASFSPVLPDMPVSTKRPFLFDPSRYTDINEIAQEDRAELSRCWISHHLHSVIAEYTRLKAAYIYLVAANSEYRDQVKVDALQHSQVIGLTTTGCTINKELLNKVKPTILIVEEAAEILESQILSCLNQESIQQVVLVGDHKQLRPIVHNYAIARDCRLDLSLFERMANNDIPVHNLTNQRRMVPAISQFVRPLYRELVDDPCLVPRKMHCDISGDVREPGDIPGLGKPVWFWNHNSSEEKSEVGLSVVNPMEVKMTLWLVKYFLARGLSSNQITVLTPYKGQHRELMEALEMAGVYRRDMCCTVDRFQGDENDVMIVSLVRTNKLTEFIKAPDRMCVLLSRARFGMVILGSANLLDTDEIPHWRQTMGTLSQNDWVGDWFPCRCDRHPKSEKKIFSEDLKDAAVIQVESFCEELCKSAYKQCKQPNRHKCQRMCHPGDHIVCEHVCGLKLSCGHICREQCGECAVGRCKCREQITIPSDNCGYYRPTRKPGSQEISWDFVPHILTKRGCNDAFGKCERPIWRKSSCGHYYETRCNQKLDDEPETCRDCINRQPSYSDFLSPLQRPPQEIHATETYTEEPKKEEFDCTPKEEVDEYDVPNDYVPMDLDNEQNTNNKGTGGPTQHEDDVKDEIKEEIPEKSQITGTSISEYNVDDLVGEGFDGFNAKPEITETEVKGEEPDNDLAMDLQLPDDMLNN